MDETTPGAADGARRTADGNSIRLTVNGTRHTLDGHPAARLLDVLRERFGLTGAKEGCGEGECGACAVLVNGRLVNACLIPAGQLDGAVVTTIEGLGPPGAARLAPLQEAMLAEGGTQCGICTPGMVMAAHALLVKIPRPSLDDVREALAGNLCRCTGYTAIYHAILKTASASPLDAAPQPPLAPASQSPLSPGGRGEGAHRWTRPRSLAEALQAMANENAPPTPIAGGTDLMVLLQMQALPPAHFLDLWGLDELRGIEVQAAQTILGALTTYAEVAEHPHLRAAYPLLVQAARVSGGWAVQNRGTIGGNIMNASPAADTPPALIAYGAQVEFASARGRRWMPYAALHTGYKQMRRQPDELLTRIALPVPAAPPTGHFYRKVGPRRAQAISRVCFAGIARWAKNVLAEARIGLASVAPTVVEARHTAAYLQGRHRAQIDLAEARAVLEHEISPIDDVRSTAAYRRRVAGNLLEQFLAETH